LFHRTQTRYPLRFLNNQSYTGAMPQNIRAPEATETHSIHHRIPTKFNILTQQTWNQFNTVAPRWLRFCGGKSIVGE